MKLHESKALKQQTSDRIIEDEKRSKRKRKSVPVEKNAGETRENQRRVRIAWLSFTSMWE